MSRTHKRCAICRTIFRSNLKHGSQAFLVEVSNYWTYSDGKTVPTVEHLYFCSKEHLKEWCETAPPPAPPADLNQWLDGKKAEAV